MSAALKLLVECQKVSGMYNPTAPAICVTSLGAFQDP